MYKVLIRLPNWLGDTVMAQPLLQGLIDSRRYSIGITAPSSCLSLLVFEEGIDERIPLQPHEAFWTQTEWRDAVADYQSILLLPTSISSALLSWWAHIPERIGYASEGRGFLLTKSIPYSEREYRKKHLTRSYIALGQLLTGKGAPFPSLPRLTGGLALSPSSPILLFPGASFGEAKRWGIERFAELSRLIRQASPRPIIIMGRDGEGINTTPSFPSDTSFLIGKTDTKGLLKHIKDAAIVIGNDSGPVHIAAALSKPTLTLFGSSSPIWTAPLSTTSRIVRVEMQCSPCFRKGCRKKRCWDALSVSMVWGILKPMMEEYGI